MHVFFILVPIFSKLLVLTINNANCYEIGSWVFLGHLGSMPYPLDLIQGNMNDQKYLRINYAHRYLSDLRPFVFSSVYDWWYFIQPVKERMQSQEKWLIFLKIVFMVLVQNTTELKIIFFGGCSSSFNISHVYIYIFVYLCSAYWSLAKL